MFRSPVSGDAYQVRKFFLLEPQVTWNRERKGDVEDRVVRSLGLACAFTEPSSVRPKMPRFLRPTSLGDIRRTSLVEETAANQRAIDEWNAASYEAGASGLTIEPGEGISAWSGWGCVQLFHLCVA